MAIKLKKGVFFTLTAIALVLIIVLGFFIENEYRLKNKMYVIETRVETVNDFIKITEKDLNRGLYIASFRALLGIQKHTTTSGSFLDDANSRFNEVILYGTMQGQEIDIMNESTFIDWTKKIEQEAEKIDIAINFSIINMTIYHQEPWVVSVDTTLLLQINDKKGTANWTKNERVISTLSIEGFEDPLYTINSFGKVINIIKKANITDFSIDSNLLNHINNSYYIESNTGPDFLMRLEGKTSSSPYGIESLVNLNKFSNQNLPTYSKSNVDYLYFGNITVSNCIINQTYQKFDWFRLDDDIEPHNHLDNYQVNCFS